MKEKLDSVQQGKLVEGVHIRKRSKDKSEETALLLWQNHKEAEASWFCRKENTEWGAIWWGIQPERGQAWSPHGGTNDKLELEDFYVSHKDTQIALEIDCIWNKSIVLVKLHVVAGLTSIYFLYLGHLGKGEKMADD